MRQLISIILGMALVFSSVSTSFAEPETREFKDCVYESNIRAHGELLNRDEGDIIAVDGTAVGAVS